jgi:teichoic acid transport system ATP-binding protein
MNPVSSVEVKDLVVSYRVYTETSMRLGSLVRSGFSGRQFTPVHAVRGVNLVIREGESVGIVGSNGSGKSTLLRTMAGLLPPTSGHVYANSEPMLLGVGAALRPSWSGRANIEIGLLALGLKDDVLEEMQRRAIEFADIGDAIERPLSTYSSGMRARLHFSIATSVSPRILMIDEALSVGDKFFKSKSYSRIDELRENAGTIVFVSHSPKEIERVCERVVWMDRGQIVADGPMEEVLEAYDGTDVPERAQAAVVDVPVAPGPGEIS